jgi:thiol-disulfide isomerase/thioredoxin
MKAKAIIAGARSVLKDVHSVRYTVSRPRSVADTSEIYTSHVTAASDPPCYFATTSGAPTAYRDLGVRDPIEQRASSEHQVWNMACPVPKEFSPMLLLCQSDAAVANTWQYLLDAQFLENIENCDKLTYVTTDDIGGTPADVIFFVRESNMQSAAQRERVVRTNYVWFSQATHLPVAVAASMIVRGNFNNSIPRFLISDVELNPKVDPNMFAYKPKPADSSAPAVQQLSKTSVKSWPETPLDDVDLRDVSNRGVKLSAFKGRPTLITFFASWCSPCRAELDALTSLSEVKSGKIQVLAIGVEDSRENLVKYIASHKGSPIKYLMDAQLNLPSSPLLQYFDITREIGIPVSLGVSPSWKVLDYVTGYGGGEAKDDEATLRARLNRIIGG